MRSTIPYLFAIALISLFMNCERTQLDSQLEMAPSFVGAGKVALDPTTLVAVSIQSGGPSSKAVSELAVPARAELTVVIDKECELEPGSLSQKTLSQTRNESAQDLPVHAYDYLTSETQLVSDLVVEAAKDPCVVEVANNVKAALHPIVRASEKFQASALATDPGFAQARHMSYIKASQGWDVFFSPGAGINKDVIVAVIDSGIDYTHQDLNANMWRSSNGTYGTDFFNNDNDPKDDNDHGTHVAGLIGAVMNNGVGISGVMGKHVKLMAIKALGADGEGNSTQIVNAIRWATDNGANVINLSVELSGQSAAVKTAMEYASARGVVIVVASGNSGKDISGANFVAPAGYCTQIPGAIAVGSLDAHNGSLSSFSNYSPSLVAIAAPGSENSDSAQGVISTVPGNQYMRLEGTSMASPLVAGSAALVVGILKSQNLTVNNAAVVSALRSSATLNGALHGKIMGSSALNVDRLGRTVKWRYMIESDGGTEPLN